MYNRRIPDLEQLYALFHLLENIKHSYKATDSVDNS